MSLHKQRIAKVEIKFVEVMNSMTSESRKAGTLIGRAHGNKEAHDFAECDPEASKQAAQIAAILLQTLEKIIR